MNRQRTERKSRSWFPLRIPCAALLLMVSVGVGTGQFPSPSAPIEPGDLDSSVHMPTPENADPAARSRQATQTRTLASERQKRLLEDTAKLVELANELQTEVSKSTKNDLSLTVIRKAGEIEKLAHDVRERERN